MKNISVIITYFRGEKFIFNCIDSLLGSYEKSKKTFTYEILLVIDSVEDRFSIIKKLEERYSKLNPGILNIFANDKNLGVCKSRNIGLGHSSYRYFTVIDQDDYVDEDYFIILENEIDFKYNVFILNGYVNYSHKSPIPMYFFKPKFEFESILYKNTLIYTPGQIIFDSLSISKSGFFIDASEEFKGCDDWAAYLNLLLENEYISYKYISSKVFVYNLHKENFSHNYKEMIYSSFAVLDYLKSISDNKVLKSQLDFSFKMLKFYFQKDVVRTTTFTTFLKFPRQFFWHYFTSFLNVDRLNRLVFNVMMLFNSKDQK